MNVLKPFDLGITSNEDAIRDLEDRTEGIEPVDLGDIVNVNGIEVVRNDYDALNAIIPDYGFERLVENSRVDISEKRVSYIGLCLMGLGSLSSEIGRLDRVEVLDLQDNKLSVLPVEFGNLINLNHLDLADNELSVLPVEIGNLAELVELNLYDNKLSFLPSELCDLANLKALGIEENPLSDYSVVDKLRKKGVEVYG